MNNDFKDFTARLRELFLNAECGMRDAEIESLALELFALQYRHNAPYRRFCDARGATPEKIKRWDQIPAVPTSAFKELELSSLPVAERTRVFHSSGTTGRRPSRHYHNAESLAIYKESLLAGFPASENGEQLLILTPPPAQAPHSSLVHMFETIRRRLGRDESAFTGVVDNSGAWSLDVSATVEVMLNAERSRTPVILLGTAFSYVHLLDDLRQRSLEFQLPPGSWAMETGGYKGRSRDLPKAELHSLIARRLGIPRSDILCEYGMSELSSQAYATRVKRGEARAGVFHFAPWARARIISPETGVEVSEGETGLIRVFDLANVYSVMAIQTEDLAVRRGHGFELIGRAVRAEPRGCSLQAV